MRFLFRRFRAALLGSARPEAIEANGLRIRSMTHSDLSAVAAIENEAFSSPWRPSTYARAVTDRRHNFFVAELDGELVGYGGFWVEGKEAHIAKVAVEASFRRRGIGSAMLRHLLAQARRLALPQAYLEVRPSNHAAQELYRQFGFRFARVQPRAYPDNGEDALVLVLDGLLEAKPVPTP
jgi:ribosomal-protein-alanine N-acetyltransferase